MLLVNTTPRWHFGEAHVNLRTQTEEEWIDDMNKEFSQLSHKVWQGVFFWLQKCGLSGLAKKTYFPLQIHCKICIFWYGMIGRGYKLNCNV